MQIVSVLNRRPFVVLAAALVTGLVVAGASISASDRNTADPLVIGLPTPITGPNAQVGVYVKEALDLWTSQINAKGGLLGRQFEYKLVDEQSNPTLGQQAMIKLITQDKVDFVMGTISSSVILREAPIAEQYHMFFISPMGTTGSIFTQGYKYLVFGGPLVAENYGRPFFQWVHNLKRDVRPKTVAFVSSNLLSTKAQVEGAAEYADQQGMTTLQKDYYDPNNTPDFNPLATKTASLKPAMVYQNGFVADTIGFAKAFCATGYKPPVLEMSTIIALDPTFPGAVGPSCSNGVISVASYDASANTPQNKAFLVGWHKMFGKSRIPTWQHASMYASLQMLEQAIRGTKSIDQDKLRDYVGSHVITTVVNSTRYDSRGVPMRQVGYVVQWQKGKRVTLWPKAAASGKFVPRR